MKTTLINQAVWNARVRSGKNAWTQPVSASRIANAKLGKWSILLTATRPVPSKWLGDVHGKTILCLASGGGQQGPILAAAGANVIVFDLSDEQLKQDRFVAERDGIQLQTVQGDMTDLSSFESGHFDLILHPVSNCFIPDVRPVWREAFRVLRPGGELIAGMVNPLLYALGEESDVDGLRIRARIPYSGLSHLEKRTAEDLLANDSAIEFGHTLEDLIGGQTEAGFHLIGFFEDRFPGKPIDEYIASLFATRSHKPWADSSV